MSGSNNDHGVGNGDMKPLKTKFYVPNVTRFRNRLTDEQYLLLESSYAINCNPSLVVRQGLSRELGLSQRSVQIWFQNRRAKSIREGELTRAGDGSDYMLQSPPTSSSVSASSPSFSTATAPSSSSLPGSAPCEAMPQEVTKVRSEYWMTTMSFEKFLTY